MNCSEHLPTTMKNLLRFEGPMEDVTIIIPVKDEEVGLEYLLKNYKDSELNEIASISFIFIIDGRTSDESRKVALEFSDNIIDQYGNHGKGAAIKQAIKIWKQNSTPYVIFLDADGSYSFQGVFSVIQELKRGYQVVSGSRFLKNNENLKGMSKLHIFGNKFLSKVSSIKNRKNITDLCTGLWGFNLEAANKLNIQSSGFDLEAEIMGKIRIEKLNHTEIAIEWSERKGGKSKLKSFKDGFIILLRILST